MRISDWSSDVCSSDLRPRSYHGVAKLASEHLIAAWCGQAAGTAIALRPSNVYGPGQHGKGGFAIIPTALGRIARSEEHTSELQSLMRISYAVFCLKKKKIL